MKKFLTLLLFISILGAFQKTQAQVVYSTGNKFSTLHQLPDSVKCEGKHVNFGVAYEQFTLFWILPVWNYGGIQYALVSDNEENAWYLDAEDVAYFKEEYNLDIPDQAEIPLWQRIGIKPIIILLIILGIWGALSGKD